MLYNEINLKKFTDGRGLLVPIEFSNDDVKKEIPFSVARTYFIIDPTVDAIRGQHAHLAPNQQVVICLKGSFTLDLEDTSGNKCSVELTDSTTGIHICDPIWRELRDFSDDCIIAVLSNRHYSEEEYIRNYSDFKSISSTAV